MEIPLRQVFNLEKKKIIVQKMRIQQSKRRKRQNLKRRQWTLTESGHYLSFLQQHQKLFQDFRTKKEAKVFVKLAKQIRSRNTSQVKSHHQKMMIKFGSIPNIIIALLEEQEVYSNNHENYLNSNKSEENSFSEPRELEKLPATRELSQLHPHHNLINKTMQPPQGRLLPGFQYSLEKEYPYLKFAEENQGYYQEGEESFFLD